MTPKKASLLVVDDNPHDIDLLTIALEEAGLDLDVRTLPDGRAAIQELRRLAQAQRPDWPDFTVLDLNMPITNGHEVLAYYASEDRLRGLPIVVLTTSDSPADRELCLARGAREYLVKPRRFADFAPIIATFRAVLASGPAAP